MDPPIPARQRLPIIIIVASLFFVTINAHAKEIYDDTIISAKVNQHIGNGVFQCTFYVEATLNGCPIKSTYWHNEAFEQFAEGYIIPQVKSATQLSFQTLPTTLVGATGCPPSLSRKSTYTCLDAPPPTCEKKIWYKDTENDGFGNCSQTKKECNKPAGYVTKCGDNCPDSIDPAQEDMDADGLGNQCDADVDGDGLKNNSDNCQWKPNSDQKNSDGDSDGDVCDACPNKAGWKFENGKDGYNNGDQDSFVDLCDNCPQHSNSDQKDGDKDGKGDACDVCPDNPDTKAQKWDYFLDKDKDGVPELATKSQPKKFCPPPPSGYASGNNVWKGWDNCPDKPNASQSDQDKDGKGDDCDICPTSTNEKVDTDGQGVPDCADDDDDGDGLSDTIEKQVLGTKPLSKDSDNDLLSDGTEVLSTLFSSMEGASNWPGFFGYLANLKLEPLKSDSDGDGKKDLEELGEGASSDVASGGSNCPQSAKAGEKDMDEDGYLDSCDKDIDGDGLLNYDETIKKLDTKKKDTDGDGLNDGQEIKYGTDPLAQHSDEDGLIDGIEVNSYGTDPNEPDSDDDGLSDSDEYFSPNKTDPLNADSDWDGLTDGVEVLKTKSNPLNPNTDGDAWLDGADNCPLNPSSVLSADTDDDGVGDSCDNVDNNNIKNSSGNDLPSAPF